MERVGNVIDVIQGAVGNSKSCPSDTARSTGFPSFGLRQDEIGEIFKDPLVLESLVDNPQKLSCQGDDRFSCPSFQFLPFIEGPQVRTISHRNQRTLHQRRPGEFVSMFGDTPRSFRFIGIVDPGHNPQIRRQFPFVLEIIHVPDHRQ